MQVVILCGGKGSRLNEYTEKIPKPLIEVGDKPILHHLMNFYASYGHVDFILCLGYKGRIIEEYFKNVTEWNINFVDTGENSNKAERLKLVEKLINNEFFFLSYGDDLSNVNLGKLAKFHNESDKVVTLTAVPLQSPFGVVKLNTHNEVIKFQEKPRLNQFMNGGFYAVSKKIFNYLTPNRDLEKEVFEHLAAENQIGAFKHNGFWKSMNTLKDVEELNDLYSQGETPWIR